MYSTDIHIVVLSILLFPTKYHLKIIKRIKTIKTIINPIKSP